MVGGAVLAWLMAMSAFDITQRRLPNWLTLPGAVAILGVTFVAGCGLQAAAGALILFAVYLSVHLLAPGALGAGDVKLAIGIGALTGSLGVDVWALAVMGAPMMTAAWGSVAMLFRLKTTVPHGLSMCLTAVAASVLVVV